MVCANGVFSQMMKQESGKIINISSSTAYQGTPNFFTTLRPKPGWLRDKRNVAELVLLGLR
jgi:NAD(P)-dependent dehydrogenase (short-subunit alcohol dehydrogenase family)